ncbi:MAG: translocation/assembly module TamB domain-containing protein [Rikenellaceae bacterium]|jgi:hypothetical protein|nr:translocation/assembly module TamB domain-containing protein [Rikenellaceae bacterium]
MIKRLIRWFLWVLLGIAGLLIVVSVLLYLPPVQRFAKDQAAAIVSRSIGWQLSIDRFRLHFPLHITVDNTVIITSPGDTLLRAGRIEAGVALWPLLAGKLQVDDVTLREAGIRYADSLGGLRVRALIDRFELRSARIGLRDSRIRLGKARLAGADVALWLSESSAPEPVDSGAPAAWTIDLSRLEVESLGFRMHTSPEIAYLTVALESGRIDEVALDMSKQLVSVELIRLSEGQYAYLTEPTTTAVDTVSATPPLPEKPTEASYPWTIRLDRLELTDNALRYGLLGGEAQPGFDANHIELSGVNVQIDDLYSRGTELTASLGELSLRERSGLAIVRGEGRLAMDSARIALSDFQLATAHSSLSAEAEIAAGVLRQEPAAPLSATLRASLDPADLYYFYTPETSLRTALSGQTLSLDGDLEGTLAQLNIHTFAARVPGHVDFRADGQVVNLLDTEHLTANLRLNGEFSDLDFLRPALPDSLGERIAFPSRMTLAGTVATEAGRYAPNLRLEADSGAMTLDAQVDLPRQVYEARVAFDAFPLDAFLPNDSLGALWLTLTASGTGFDPRQEGTKADINMSLNELTYQKYTYRAIDLEASLADHALTGTLTSDDSAARLHLDLTGEVRPEQYTAHLQGRIDTLDLYRMGFMTESFDASLSLDATAMARPDTAYYIDLQVDSVRWRQGERTEHIPLSTLTASATAGRITAAARSGDLSLDFAAPVSVDSLLSGFTRTAAELSEQGKARSLDAARIEECLPPLNFTASAGRENLLHSLMSGSGMDFQRIDLRASTLDGQPLQVDATVDKFNTGGLTLDTLRVGLRRNDKAFNYFARLANRPGHTEQVSLIALSGTLVENRATANLYQRDRADSVGFRFGLNAELLESAIRVNLTPQRPIFGYLPWQVNADNYIIYRFDRTMEADLRLQGPQAGQHVSLLSAALEPTLAAGALRLEIAGFDLGRALSLLPASPPVTGILHTALTVGFDRGQPVAAGTLGINALAYSGQRVGDVGMDIDFQSDSLSRFSLDAAMTLDSLRVLTATGSYQASGEGAIAIQAAVASLPLATVNAFLPPETAQLSGALTGSLAVSGSTAQPAIDGAFRFADGHVSLPMIGTAFGISDRPITVKENRLTFDRFALIAPNNAPMTLDGAIDFADPARMTADLKLTATNFDAIRSARRDGSMIYGTVPIDVDLTARGGLNALTVRGDIRLRRGASVTYTLREGPLEVENVEQQIVTFVDFNDPETFEKADSVARLTPFGMDMLVNIAIEESVQATVNISEDGNNRAEVAGSGNLAYSLNPQGDSRLMGRFDIASGRILYQPPVIAQKDFTIGADSYVEWTGAMLNPTFDITATESVRTSVTGEYEGTVDFDISILIRNSLENIDVSFDLAAPNTLPIQNELALMTPEQRSQQAMGLLLYNTYTGAGSSASVDTGNPLNAFIAKELNQWARNNLQGVDVSFGIDSSDRADGGTRTDYSYQLSKNLFNDRVKVTVGGSIASDANATQNLQNNFVDDISIEYRLTEGDNMFLKAYRYNTQESILEGEITETGAGFLVRKRMNRLGELFQLAGRDDRRQRREARRQERQDAETNQ